MNYQSTNQYIATSLVALNEVVNPLSQPNLYWAELRRTVPSPLCARGLIERFTQCSSVMILGVECLSEGAHITGDMGHNCWVIPEEERFVTRELIEATCMVGTTDQLIERLVALDTAGLDQVMILPSYEPRYEVLERVARDLLPQLQAS